MQKGIFIGRVWGIPLYLHLSWFIIFGLVTWSLASGYFPVEFPDMDPVLYWVLGALTSLLFAVSVLLHELGHAFVAQRKKVPVKDVTLFLFGGIAQIEKEAETPGEEFQIAIAGPLTSLLLGLVFLGIWYLDRSLPVLSAPSSWLARINLSLAIFNMIPGFPLDGGRVLRSIIWKFNKNLHKATKIAAFTGQVTAFIFITLGIVIILTGNMFDGIWLAFIGWFLQNAASASQAQSTLKETLKGVKVSQVMESNLPRIAWYSKLDELVEEHVLTGGQKIFLVTDNSGEYLRGMLTLRNITDVPRQKWHEVIADEVMIPRKSFIAVNPDSSLLDALQRMDDANVAQVPVMLEDHVLGILTREQIVHYFRLRAEIGM